MKDHICSCWIHIFPLKSCKLRTTWKQLLSSSISIPFPTDTLWNIRESNSYRPCKAHTFAHITSTHKQVLRKGKKKKKGNPDKPLPTIWTHWNTGLVCLQSQPITGVINTSNRFPNNMFQKTFLLSAREIANSYKELSPLNICCLNWSYRKGHNWCCLKRCHSTTTRTIRLSLRHLMWLPKKKKKFCQRKISPSLWSSVTLAPWMLVSHQPLRINSACHNSSLAVQLGHLAELDAPSHNIKLYSWRKSLYSAWEEFSPP